MRCTHTEPFDAVIQAGFGEHGREGLQELVDVPVLDITEAAAIVAMLIGRTYSVVTTLDRTVPMIEDRLMLAGLTPAAPRYAPATCLSWPSKKIPKPPSTAIVAQAQAAVHDDKAEVIILGCGGMAGLDQRIQQDCGVPVVDGISAAVCSPNRWSAIAPFDLQDSDVRCPAAANGSPVGPYHRVPTPDIHSHESEHHHANPTLRTPLPSQLRIRISPRLYNKDLKPAEPHERQW